MQEAKCQGISCVKSSALVFQFVPLMSHLVLRTLYHSAGAFHHAEYSTSLILEKQVQLLLRLRSLYLCVNLQAITNLYEVDSSSIRLIMIDLLNFCRYRDPKSLILRHYLVIDSNRRSCFSGLDLVFYCKNSSLN